MHEDSFDDDLHARLMAGDQAALAEAFSRHRDRLHKVVLFRRDARLATRVDSDDLLQEAFLQASQRLHHFAKQNTDVDDGDSDDPQRLGVYLWLRLIVHQTLIDAHRRYLGTQKRNAARDVAIHAKNGHDGGIATSLSLAQRLVGKLTSPSQAALRAELSEQLQAALATMSQLDQEVIALRHFEELSNSEVAKVLEIEGKAASIRYVRALRRLKEVLSELSGFRDLQIFLGG